MYNLEIVLTAIDLYNKCNSYNKTASTLKLYRQTVTNWIKSYKDNLPGLTKRIERFIHKNYSLLTTKHNLKLDNKLLIDFISETIYLNPHYTKKQMIELIKQKININISMRGLNKIYKKLNLTRKKVKKHIIKNINYIDTLSKLRMDFTNKINTIFKETPHKIISIDETGIKKFIGTLFGYAPKGVNINIPINSKSFTNQSIIIALTTSGILSYEITGDNVNTNIYYDFIENVISKLTSKGYVFIFDNVSFHNHKSILKLINDNGHTYIFTPNYSPNLNPIENVNGILKQKINKMVYDDISNNDIKMKDKKEIKEKVNIISETFKNELKNTIGDERNKIKNEKIQKIQELKENNKLNLKDDKKTKEEKKKIKEELKTEIKEIRKTNKTKLNKNIKRLKETNKKNKKMEISNIKNDDITKIRKYINRAIIEFNNEYNETKINKIYSHAFTFDHSKIEKELKDRINFIK
jgi:transposase